MFLFCAVLVSGLQGCDDEERAQAVRTGRSRSRPKVAFERGSCLCRQAVGHFGGRRERNRCGPKVAGEVAGQCEVCLAGDKAPRMSTAGTPTASAFNE